MNKTKIILLGFCTLVSPIAFGASVATSVPTPTEIVANITPQLGVDDYRKALTQKEVAVTLVRL